MATMLLVVEVLYRISGGESTARERRAVELRARARAEDVVRGAGGTVLRSRASNRYPTKEENVLLTPRRWHYYEQSSPREQRWVMSTCKRKVSRAKVTRNWPDVTCAHCLKHAPPGATTSQIEMF